MANQNTTMMDLDFTGVESFANIPLGTHSVTVKDATFTKAKNTGSDQLQLNFEDAYGATKMMWCSLVPQALWKVKGVLEALGIPCEGKIRLNTKTMIGKRCVISVEFDPNDESRQIVARVMRADSVAPAAAPEAPFNAAPIPSTSFVQPTPAPAPIPSPTAAIPTNPMMPQTPPSEPVAAPTQPEPAAPQGNMPPWMQAAQNTANSAPQGNLPPWMRPKQ